MDGRITGFIVWAVFGCMFIGLAIYVWFSKKPAGFWANVETLEVFDIKNITMRWRSCSAFSA